MKHLSPEEIIEFISISEITPSSLSLASRVNTHIRSCKSCLEKLQAYQSIQEALIHRNRQAEDEILANEIRRKQIGGELVDMEK